MFLWTAFLLGLVGSLHCAGMCGPLALALPVVGSTRGQFILSRLLYNAGRLASYVALGGLFGMAGQTLAFAGFQRWLSLGAGAAMLIGLFLSLRYGLNVPAWRLVAWLKKGFGTILQKKSFLSLFALGALNGLLPCGLVYVAATGAVASGAILGGMSYMAAFGFGTLPVMLGIALAGRIHFLSRIRLQSLIPFSIALVAILLIVRGLSLGIPYLSPDLSTGQPNCAACADH